MIGGLALLVRAGLVLRSPGGPTGLFGYDPGVYYAAGDALIHGPVPYRDFLLLHPPAVMLATAPFAALGSWTRDDIGFVTANSVFMCIGALNAAFVVVAGRRLVCRSVRHASPASRTRSGSALPAPRSPSGSSRSGP